MLLEKEFWKTVDKLGLEDHELDLAELVWSKAERAMQGLPSQTASLLTAKTPVLKIKKVSEPNPINIEREDLQFLSSFLSQVLSGIGHGKKTLRDKIASYWKVCLPEDEETKKHFDQMNYLKEKYRKVRKVESKLSGIQRKLKKQLNNGKG